MSSHKSKPMTMKQWEKSSMDKKADKTGKHGKEGSAKDAAADKRGMKAYNAKTKPKAKY